jgi:hypothetical protein
MRVAVIASTLTLAVAACATTRPAASTYPPLSAASFTGEPAFDPQRFGVRDASHRAALLDTIRAQERRWLANRPESYSYGIVRSCACTGQFLYYPYRVTVRGGRAVISDSLGRIVRTDREDQSPLSIIEVFADLKDALANRVPYVQVMVDPEHAYPSFSLTDVPGVTDSFFIVKIRQFSVP